MSILEMCPAQLCQVLVHSRLTKLASDCGLPMKFRLRLNLLVLKLFWLYHLMMIFARHLLAN
jgi:hypothetical protein